MKLFENDKLQSLPRKGRELKMIPKLRQKKHKNLLGHATLRVTTYFYVNYLVLLKQGPFVEEIAKDFCGGASYIMQMTQFESSGKVSILK